MANQVRSKPARLPARRAVRVCYGGNGSASTDSARYLSGLTPGLVPLRILLYPRTSLSRTPSFWRLDSSRSLVKLRLLDRGATVMPSRPFRYRFVANGLVHVRLRGRLQLRQATRGLASRQSGREIDHDARKSLGSGAHASPSNGPRCDRGRASTHHRSGGSRIGHVVTEPRHTVPFATAVSAAPSASASGSRVTLLAAGDIAECGNSESEATARTLAGLPGTIATLCDNAYERGPPAEYTHCFGPTWGPPPDRIRPPPGHRE